MSTALPAGNDSETEFAPFPVRRFSVAEYRQLGASGVLTENDRVELLDCVQAESQSNS